MKIKKKRNIFKSIFLGVCACFIAVFSVFSLVNNQEKLEVSASAPESDTVFNYNIGLVPYSFMPRDFSSFVSSDTSVGYGNSYFTVTYPVGGNITVSVFYSRFNGLVYFNNFSDPYRLFSSSSNIINYSVNPSSTYNFSFSPNSDFSYIFSGSANFIYANPDYSSYNWSYFSVQYNNDENLPLSFDVLDIYYLSAGSTLFKDMNGLDIGSLNSIVYSFHSFNGNSTSLDFVFYYVGANPLGPNSGDSQTVYLKSSSGSGGGSYQEGYDLGYSTGYREGVSSGYQTGLSENTQSSFNSGYDAGYIDGESSGYNDGYIDGQTLGYTEAYNDGKNYGYNLGKNEVLSDSDKYSFTRLITSVIDVPINSFRSLFNFEVLGVDLSGFFLGLLTCCIVISIIRMIV